jgi:hypothetical protein
MLAVLLGASEFPKSPQLLESRSFSNSAYEIRKYLYDEKGMGLPKENILSLFDDTRSSSDQLEEIADFLSERGQYLKSSGSSPEHLLIYYVGHGLFTRGADQAYCLAVRNTNRNNEGPTSLRAADLATVVKENARHLKRYLVLDCCFAASIQKEFQSGALSAVRVQINREFPERGTALMCSSNAYEPSRAPQGLEHTMFSSALLRSLRTGDKQCGRLLTFSELGDLVRENIREVFPEDGVRPEVHSPDQREGDVANVPLFPNPAFVERHKAESSVGTGPANRRPMSRPGRIAAPYPQRQRATQKIETQKRTQDGRTARKEQGQDSAPAKRPASRGKVSAAKPAKLLNQSSASQRKAAEAHERKLARLENERKVQLAAKKAAEKLLLEWRRNERAKELERKRLAKQRAEERRARQIAEEERTRKERFAAQEAAADRELKRLRYERAKAEAQKRSAPTASNRKGRPASSGLPKTSGRIPTKGREVRTQQKARRAAPLAEAASLYRRAASETRPGSQSRDQDGSPDVKKKAQQNAAADRELKRIRRERAKAAEKKRLAKQKSAEIYDENVEEDLEQDTAENGAWETNTVETWTEGDAEATDVPTRPKRRGWLAKWLT